MTAPEPSPGGASSGGAASAGAASGDVSPAGGPLGAGYSSVCLAAGTVMLAVPTAIALTALPAPGSGGSPGTGLLLAVVLAIGALAVALATARPGSGVMAALAVLCTALALVLEPPEALGDGLCGLACLAFLLAIRLHRQARSGPVNLSAWLAAHRPLAVGAAVTTPAAIAAASVPTAWSLPVAALVGLGSVAVCALIFR
ncbi:MAG TPA: hypothetical protein VK735_33140 [Pseudonocardia sp.]|uniref:hypothetical protein n=1 Tax=Pseudonocardia sp. TaxID=60912 RepID=UPI002BB26148|nr:hypothetical protein [Pseudonocardia sp.]HTF52316.1 hypothetical protein [Pseudonocardia sp.]